MVEGDMSMPMPPPPSHGGSSDADVFCSPAMGEMGAAMLMGGFQAGFGGKDATCVNFLFRGWIVDTPAKYAMCVAGTFFLAFMNDALLRGRALTQKKLPVNVWSHLLRSCLYGLQMVLAYFLMLTVMLFEQYIFTAVIVGLAAGQFFWGGLDIYTRRRSKEGRRTSGHGDDSGGKIGGIPTSSSRFSTINTSLLSADELAARSLRSPEEDSIVTADEEGGASSVALDPSDKPDAPLEANTPCCDGIVSDLETEDEL